MLNRLKSAIVAFWQDERGDLGSVIGIGSSLIGGIMGSNAAGDAADTQQAAAEQAAQLAAQTQLSQYGQTRSDQMPWLTAGAGAENQLAYLMGITPQSMPTSSQIAPYMPGYVAPTGGSNQGGSVATPPAGSGTAAGLAGSVTPNYPGGGFGSLSKPFTMADFTADPGYAFSLQQGQQALERSVAAKGGLMSGAALKAITQYGVGTANQEYGQVYDRYRQNQTDLYNRLAGIDGTGQTTASGLGNQGAAAAQGAANAYEQGGNAASAGIIGQNNAFQTGLGQIGSTLSNYFGGGGGGSYGGGSSYYPNSGTQVNWF